MMNVVSTAQTPGRNQSQYLATVASQDLSVLSQVCITLLTMYFTTVTHLRVLSLRATHAEVGPTRTQMLNQRRSPPQYLVSKSTKHVLYNCNPLKCSLSERALRGRANKYSDAESDEGSTPEPGGQHLDLIHTHTCTVYIHSMSR